MVVKTYPNPRVLIVHPNGDIEFYRPEGRDLEVNGDFGYESQKDEIHRMYGGRIAVVLKNFKGEIGVPRGVPVKVERHYGCNKITGTLSGPCYIESQGFADLMFPEDIEVIARGKDIIKNGENVIPDGYNDDPEKGDWWIHGKEELRSAMRKRPDYRIEAPRKIVVNGQIRMVKSLGCLPIWMSDELVLAEMHNLVYVNAEKVSIAEYEDEAVEEKSEGGLEMSLYSYMMACAQGLSFDEPETKEDKPDVENKTDKPDKEKESGQSDEDSLESANRAIDDTDNLIRESQKLRGYIKPPEKESVSPAEKQQVDERRLIEKTKSSLWRSFLNFIGKSGEDIDESKFGDIYGNTKQRR